jgi:hypothetical protein
MRWSIGHFVLTSSIGLLIQSAALADQLNDGASAAKHESAATGAETPASPATAASPASPAPGTNQAETAQPPSTHPQAAPAKTDASPAKSPFGPGVALGSTRAEVIAALGYPTSFSPHEGTLIYGDRGIVFIDDHVAGWVSVDPDVASRLAISKFHETRETLDDPATKNGRHLAHGSRQGWSNWQSSQSDGRAGYRAAKRYQNRGYVRPSYRTTNSFPASRSRSWLSEMFPPRTNQQFDPLTGADGNGGYRIGNPRSAASRRR